MSNDSSMENKATLSSSRSEPSVELILEHIDNERGFSRKWPRILAKRDPEFTLKLHEVVHHALNHPGELAVKHRELIMMALNAADEAERGFRLHMQQALRHGATEGEILEVLKLVGVIHLHGLTSMLPIFEEVMSGNSAAT